MISMRFNFVLPGLDPAQLSRMYRAALDMAAFGEDHGFAGVTFEEHHDSDNGWSPSPLANAALVLGRTDRINVMVSALLLPLHDPIRIAEDLAVLDVAGGGRLTTILGIGYRPSEYAAHRKDWDERGRIMDADVEALLRAWTGEPFVYHGAMVRVTPKPLTQPHPPVFIGGASRAAARRAARLGLPLLPTSYVPEVETYYYEQCVEYGTTGICQMMPPNLAMVHVAEDPDHAWADLGRYFLAEAAPYAKWQVPGVHSPMHSHALTVDDLRAEGIYKVLTPAQCVEHLKTQGDQGLLALHPLVGGMPIDEAWKSVQLVADEVVPRLA